MNDYIDPELIVNKNFFNEVKDIVICPICKGIINDSMQCNLCENNIISSQIENKPTKEEEKNLAYRVEIYKCEKCKYDNIRFPRYNNPLKLLETKRRQ